jgi:hypothetical protein
MVGICEYSKNKSIGLERSDPSTTIAARPVTAKRRIMVGLVKAT